MTAWWRGLWSIWLQALARPCFLVWSVWSEALLCFSSGFLSTRRQTSTLMASRSSTTALSPPQHSSSSAKTTNYVTLLPWRQPSTSGGRGVLLWKPGNGKSRFTRLTYVVTQRNISPHWRSLSTRLPLPLSMQRCEGL